MGFNCNHIPMNRKSRAYEAGSYGAKFDSYSNVQNINYSQCGSLYGGSCNIGIASATTMLQNIFSSIANSKDTTQVTQNVQEEGSTPLREAKATIVKEETAEDVVDRLVDVDKNKNATLYRKLVEKYESIKAADSNISEEYLALRLKNYAKALSIREVELTQKIQQAQTEKTVVEALPEGTSIEKVNTTIENVLKAEFNDDQITYDKNQVKSDKDLQNHFKTLGNQYVEVHDDNANLEIDIFELITKNLTEHYLVSGVCKNIHDAKQKAKDYVEANQTNIANQLATWDIEQQATPLDNSPENMLVLNSYLEMLKFDSSKDKVLTVDEASVMLAAKSTYADNSYDISAADDFKFNSDLILEPEKVDEKLKRAQELN